MSRGHLNVSTVRSHTLSTAAPDIRMEAPPRGEPRRWASSTCPSGLPQRAAYSSLIAVQRLALRVERLSLSYLPVDGNKALQVERFARLLDALGPQLRARSLVALLGRGGRLLGDDLAIPVLHQARLRQ